MLAKLLKHSFLFNQDIIYYFQNNCDLSPSHETLTPEACLVNGWDVGHMRKICHRLTSGKEESIYILLAFLFRILCLTLASCWWEPLFVRSEIAPTLLQHRPGVSHKGGVLWAVTIWDCWRSAGHCFLWRQMVIVVSNIAMESLTEQHDPGFWDFQITVKNIFCCCWYGRKTQGMLLRKCNELTTGGISVVTHTSKVSELKTGKIWTFNLTHFIYALSDFL